MQTGDESCSRKWGIAPKAEMQTADSGGAVASLALHAIDAYTHAHCHGRISAHTEAFFALFVSVSAA